MRNPDRTLALELAQEIMRKEVEAIQALAESLGDAFWKCSQLLSNCSGLIWVTGVGTSRRQWDRALLTS